MTQQNEKVKKVGGGIETLDGDKGVARWISKPLDRYGANVAADLQLLVKSQKDPASFRVISAVPGYPYVGLSRWLSNKIRGILKAQGATHLIESGKQFAEAVDGMLVPRSARFGKLDLKEFVS